MLLVILGTIPIKQGIFEIEAGAFDESQPTHEIEAGAFNESQPTHEIVCRKCPIIFLWNFFCRSEKHLIICTYARMRTNTSHSVEKQDKAESMRVTSVQCHIKVFITRQREDRRVHYETKTACSLPVVFFS